jgi:hypothetical protein
VQRLADQASLAIQNARQFRGHVRRQEELAVLYDIVRVFSGPLGSDAFSEAVHPMLGRLLDVRRMLALRWDADVRAFELVWASAPGWSPDDTALETRVVEGGRVIRTADYLAICEAEGVKPSAFAHGLRHATLVPMSLVDRAVGVLALWSADRALKASHLREPASGPGRRRPLGCADRAVLDGVGGHPPAERLSPGDERDPRADHLRVGQDLLAAVGGKRAVQRLVSLRQRQPGVALAQAHLPDSFGVAGDHPEVERVDAAGALNRCTRSAVQSPMAKSCDTRRLPGASSPRSFGRSLRLTSSRR